MNGLLQAWATGQVFAVMLVLTRLGAAMAVFPGFGLATVPVRVRLLMALAFSAVVAPTVAPLLPGLPASPAELALLISREVIFGLFIGTVARALTASLETAGNLIALQAGISSATLFNPAFQGIVPLPGVLMGMLGSTLLFVTDLHHALIRAAVSSYRLFPATGTNFPAGDMAQSVVRLTSEAFILGIQLAAPFLAVGLLLFLLLGLLARLMPALQVFFIAQPAQIALGLVLFAGTLSAMMLVWLDRSQDVLRALGGGR